MKKYQYSLAYYDQKMGTADMCIKMPMDGVPVNVSLPEFLQSAGEHGWLLCGSMDSYIHDNIKSVYGNRTLTDPKEVLELIFVKEV